MKNQPTELPSKKLGLEQLRKIWDDEHKTYTDEELFKIREWLYVVADIVISVANKIETQYREEQTKVISLQSIQHETKSNLVHQSEYRRAS